MSKTFTQLDDAASRLLLYRLQPQAALPTEKQVRDAALALGLTLPDDYVDQCCRFGAVAFEKRACLALPEGCAMGRQFWLDIVYAIGAQSDWDPLQLWSNGLRYRLPVGLLPIATDPGGNLLLLGLGERQGLFVWDHEHRELQPGEFDQRVAELRAVGEPTHELDVDELMLRWETRFVERVSNPSGNGNLYPVAPSWAEACRALHELLL